MNKTAIAVTSIIASAFVIIGLPSIYWYLNYLGKVELTKIEVVMADKDKIDKFTNCLQVVRGYSNNGQLTSVEKAKNICVHAKDGNINK